MAASPDQDRIDRALLHRLVRRDEEALGELYDRYASPLFGIAYQILSNRSEAEEAVQDVFTVLWRKCDTFDEKKGRLFAWLTVMVRNQSIDRLRKSGRRLPLSSVEPDENANRVETTALDELFAAEQATQIRKLVAGLPEEQREAIRLAFFSGLTHVEVAERLGISLGTIKSRIRYGMQKLRILLKGGETS